MKNKNWLEILFWSFYFLLFFSVFMIVFVDERFSLLTVVCLVGIVFMNRFNNKS